jgi:hypothetical protein
MIRNDHGVVFLIREGVVAIADIKLPQSVKDMVLQSWYKILSGVVRIM